MFADTARITNVRIIIIIIFTKHLSYLPAIKPSFEVKTRPSNPMRCTMDLPIDMGVDKYSLKWRLLPPLVLPKSSLNNRADHINMVTEYQK